MTFPLQHQEQGPPPRVHEQCTRGAGGSGHISGRQLWHIIPLTPMTLL